MDAVSEVKARLSIEDVVSEYVQLKRAGKNYKALSPFTNEKTASFVVSPDKQIWHDFSSGKGGDMFSFIQEVESLDFKGSLELLARKAGVDLSQFKTGSSNSKQKERLYEINEAATKFYQVQLTVNKKAIDYVVGKRQFNKQTLIDFRLGYSPDGGQVICDYLLKKGYKPEEIKQAGLASERRKGVLGDMFRGRLMIPLCDQFGRPVGFTARILTNDPKAPKYINTPSTLLYDKSRHVYGLHLAKKAIQSQKFSVLCEGNLDVISSHQADIKNVVATAGTALTEMQLKALGRFSPDVRLAFDEDKAGLAATERAIPVADKTDVNLSVVTIPSGKDPDELIRQDPGAWRQAVDNPQYALDWLIDKYKKQYDLTSAIGKKQFSSVILPVVDRLKSDIEKDHYIGVMAEILGSDKSAVKSSIGRSAESPKPRLKAVKSSSQKPDKSEAEKLKISGQLLAICLMMPKMRTNLTDITAEMLAPDEAGRLLDFLVTNPEYDGKPAEGLKQITDYVKMSTLLFEELYSDVDTIELQYEATRLKARLIEIFVKDQKQQIMAAMDGQDEKQAAESLQRVRDLNRLQDSTKEMKLRG